MGFGRRKESWGSRPLSTILPEGVKLFSSRANAARRIQQSPTSAAALGNGSAGSANVSGASNVDNFDSSPGSTDRPLSIVRSISSISIKPKKTRKAPKIQGPVPVQSRRYETASTARSEGIPIEAQKDLARHPASNQPPATPPAPAAPFLTLNLDTHSLLPEHLLDAATFSSGSNAESKPTYTSKERSAHPPTPPMEPIVSSTEKANEASADQTLDLSHIGSYVNYGWKEGDESHLGADSTKSKLASSTTLNASHVLSRKSSMSRHHSEASVATESTVDSADYYPHKPMVMTTKQDRKIVINHGVYIFDLCDPGRELKSSLEDGFSVFDYE